ncbi:hypothetical protein LCGC14_0729710 [marine sediment metagenome]|uniref:ribonucleoside-triphosphate reductase (thioredoxin) n=1 Tax=marine sediment metagenome TaxID=412755 RepID=A0A0F9QE94_9ZZZZ
MIVEKRFHLPQSIIAEVAARFKPSFGFGGFGEIVYYRTYSRPIDLDSPIERPETKNETWLDTCVRVVEGCFSIRKDWYYKIGLKWEEAKWQAIARQMLEYLYQMKFLAPGRGLFSMGSEHVFNIGSMALNNCANTNISCDSLADDLAWSMDALMCGCGVGYKLEISGPLVIQVNPKALNSFDVIPDTREGWVNSVHDLIKAQLKGFDFEFDYDSIRAFGEPIKGFGGVASGPAPLMILHCRIRHFFKLYQEGKINKTRFICDLINAVGTCVVSGNVRRGAQIIIGSPNDLTFLDLKNYKVHTDNETATKIQRVHERTFEYSKTGDNRGEGYDDCLNYLNNNDLPSESYLADRLNISSLSNNSCFLDSASSFSYLETIAQKNADFVDMGMINVMNIQRYGRFGHRYTDNDYLRLDHATSCNPCGEIPLEDKELCNLVELFPTRCESVQELKVVARIATIYAQSVSLLMTHSYETNSVLSKNRRIGVSISGIADWLDQQGAARLTKIFREVYLVVRQTARAMAQESGVPEPIRVTTVKPSGTISQLAGVSSGMHFPTFQYAIRRIRISIDSPLGELMKAANIPWEPDIAQVNTNVFSYPINQGKTRPATKVSAWEQFALLAMLQREWSDNMVSCTVYWNPETEKNQIEQMLGQFAPLIKSVSLLPHSPKGAFKQMPYEGISSEQFIELKRKIKPIDFSNYNSLGKMENPDATLYCENDSCEI